MKKYNHISKDIEKKHQEKITKIYDFITSDKSINEFVKIYDDSFANTYLDFRKFLLQNYKRVFISNTYFLHVLIERGIKRSVKNKIEQIPHFEFKVSDAKLKSSFVKAVKKWILFQDQEKSISDTLYSFAKLNTKAKDKDLKTFLEKWNMNRCHYYNARTGFLKNGLVIEKVIKQVPLKKDFDFTYTFTEPASARKMRNEKIHLEKKRSKVIINEFIKSHFTGRTKGTETIKAFKVLNIPLDASIKEIKELLNNK
jgi:hypothetical protein